MDIITSDGYLYSHYRTSLVFVKTVRDETDLEKLTNELVNVVQETMQPKSVSLWLKREKGSK